MATKKTDTIIIPIEIDENGLNRLNDNINETVQVTKSLKSQLKEMTLELQNIEPGTARFYELTAAAGQLKDQINDTNAAIKATAGSATENLAKGLGSVASVGIAGFQGMASAAALFGGESEAVQQSLLKLQALAGLGDAVKSLGALGDTMTEIKASFLAAATQLGLFTTAKEVDIVVTEGQTIATEGATVATNVLGKSMNALPIFAIIAGITAVVGAIAYFASQTEEAAISEEQLNEVTKQTGDAFGKAKQQVLEVGISFAAAKKGIISNEQALKDYNDKLGGVIGNAKTLDEAEKLYSERSGAYVKATTIRAQAQALSALAGQKYAETYEKLQNTELTAYETSQVAFTLAAKGRAAAEGQVRGYIAIKRKEAIEDLKKDTKEINDQVASLTEQALAIEQKAGITSSQIQKQNTENKKEVVKEEKKTQEEINKIIADRLVYLSYANKTEVEGEQTKLNNIKRISAEKLIADYDATEKALEARRESIERTNELELEQQGKLIELNELKKENLKKDLDEELILLGNNEAKKAEVTAKYNLEVQKIDDDTKEKRIANQKAIGDAVSGGLNAIGDLVTAFAGKSDAAQKRAFEINKKIKIGNAIMATYQAANEALASPANNLFPGQNVIMAGIAVAAGLANVKNIASTKYEGGGSGGSGGSSTPSVPSMTNTTSTTGPATPSFNLFGSGGNQNNVGPNGPMNGEQNIVVTAVVSETEMTNVQNKVKGIKTNAEL
jgi:hypothetical protein